MTLGHAGNVVDKEHFPMPLFLTLKEVETIESSNILRLVSVCYRRHLRLCWSCNLLAD